MGKWINPGFTLHGEAQPAVNHGADCREMRQMLGSGKIADTFKKGAPRYPVCPTCHTEVAPADESAVVTLGDTAFEQILLMGGKTLTFHKSCEVPPKEQLIARFITATFK